MDFAIWLIIAPVAVVALCAAWRAAGSFLFSTYAKPRRMPIAETPADFGLDYRDIEFKSEDGIVLKGWLIHPPDHTEGDRLPAVITTHGYSTNRSDIIERTAAVAAAGFLVLTFDWRNSGESEGEICTGGLYEQNDLRAAIDYLASLPDADPERIAVYGFSMGAVVAILVASSDERVRAVVTDSPYVNMWEEARHVLWNMFIPPVIFLSSFDKAYKKKFGAGMREIDAAAAAPGIAPRPLLVLHGERDRVVPPWHPKAVYEAANEPKRIETNPDGGHFDNASPETLSKVIIPFLQKSLRA